MRRTASPDFGLCVSHPGRSRARAPWDKCQWVVVALFHAGLRVLG